MIRERNFGPLGDMAPSKCWNGQAENGEKDDSGMEETSDQVGTKNGSHNQNLQSFSFFGTYKRARERVRLFWNSVLHYSATLCLRLEAMTDCLKRSTWHEKDQLIEIRVLMSYGKDQPVTLSLSRWNWSHVDFDASDSWNLKPMEPSQRLTKWKLARVEMFIFQSSKYLSSHPLSLISLSLSCRMKRPMGTKWKNRESRSGWTDSNCKCFKINDCHLVFSPTSSPTFFHFGLNLTNAKGTRGTREQWKWFMLSVRWRTFSSFSGFFKKSLYELWQFQELFGNHSTIWSTFCK